MMRDLGLKTSMTFGRQCVLDVLRVNHTKHLAIVKEANAGYVKAATAAVTAKLAALQEGRCVPLHFTLTPPVDHTDAYQTVIRMLELSDDQTITLGASEFRKLMMDEWDWTDHFLSHNAAYSGTARAEALSKKLEQDS